MEEPTCLFPLELYPTCKTWWDGKRIKSRGTLLSFHQSVNVLQLWAKKQPPPILLLIYIWWTWHTCSIECALKEEATLLMFSSPWELLYQLLIWRTENLPIMRSWSKQCAKIQAYSLTANAQNHDLAPALLKYCYSL